VRAKREVLEGVAIKVGPYYLITWVGGSCGLSEG
jgi:hypothetical protein